MAPERSNVFNNGNKKSAVKFLPCISKTLFDMPPQSNIFILQWFYNALHTILILLSKFTLGQFLITIFDYNMVKIEKTLDFCIPQYQAEAVMKDHVKNLTTTDRPTTWIFFIPALIILRYVRFWLSVYSVIMGRGEVTARQMQMKIVAFRRYYRSVRHYAVNRFSDDDLKKRDKRMLSSFLWRTFYNAFEIVFMMKPPVEHHSNMLPENGNGSGNGNKPTASPTTSPVTLRVTDVGRHRSPRNIINVKSSLNKPNKDSTDDEHEDVMVMKEKTKPMKFPREKLLPTTNEKVSISSCEEAEDDDDSEIDTENVQFSESLKEEIEENSKKMSPRKYQDESTTTKRSKNDEIFNLNEQQLKQLEDQLVTRFMSYFQQNYNYPPSETFYSPIGSPPKKFTFDTDEHETSSTKYQQEKSEEKIQEEEISSTVDEKNIKSLNLDLDSSPNQMKFKIWDKFIHILTHQQLKFFSTAGDGDSRGQK